MENNAFFKKIGSEVIKNLVTCAVTTLVGCVMDRAIQKHTTIKVESVATPETEIPVTTEAVEATVTETDIPEVNAEIVE